MTPVTRVSPDAIAPHGRWGVLASVGAGTFMSAMGGSAIYTVLPIVTRAFGADVAAIEWVLTVYLLVVSSVLLTFGRLGDLHGHRRVYLAGFVVLLLASALCGLAPTPLVLIAARAGQAVGAAMLFSNGPAILTAHFPGHQRGRALGMQAAMTYLGLTAGPSLGGWVAAAWGWRAVFYVNVPVGFLAIALSLRCLPDDRPGEARERFDVPGAVLFALGLGALLAALNQGHAWGWGSPPILAGFALAAVLLGVFLLVEQRVPAPMLDLSLFRRRTFSAAAASAVLNYVSVNSVIFLVPFYLIDGRGLSPAQAGLVLTTPPIVMAVMAPLAGALSDRIGSRAPATLGMAIMAAACIALSRLGPDTPLRQVVATLTVFGLANGLFSSPNNSALMGAAPRHRLGVASGILACARNTGMVLGVGLAGAVFTTVLAHPVGVDAVTLVHAIDVTFLVAAGVAAVGAATSAVR